MKSIVTNTKLDKQDFKLAQTNPAKFKREQITAEGIIASLAKEACMKEGDM